MLLAEKQKLRSMEQNRSLSHKSIALTAKTTWILTKETKAYMDKTQPLQQIMWKKGESAFQRLKINPCFHHAQIQIQSDIKTIM
jgi:hypothetical protein